MSDNTSFTSSSEATSFVIPSKATGFITPSNASSFLKNANAGRDARYNMLMEDSKSGLSQNVTSISENKADIELPIMESSIWVSMGQWVLICVVYSKME